MNTDNCFLPNIMYFFDFFVLDDSFQEGKLLMFGGVEHITENKRTNKVFTAWINIPSLRYKQIKQIYQLNKTSQLTEYSLKHYNNCVFKIVRLCRLQSVDHSESIDIQYVHNMHCMHHIKRYVLSEVHMSPRNIHILPSWGLFLLARYVGQ